VPNLKPPNDLQVKHFGSLCANIAYALPLISLKSLNNW
jgi:hypothetical protein